jgi:hypothetical protein
MMPPIKEMNDNAQAKPDAPHAWGSWRVCARLAVVLLVAYSIGAGLNRLGTVLDRAGHPAGFPRGVVQGALMPMALPNLLFGKDVIIYSLNNTGVGYKLGYTTGVNVCGAIFFGFFFWRLNRWRKSTTRRAD